MVAQLQTVMTGEVGTERGEEGRLDLQGKRLVGL
jgi:hypothetical protein